MPRIGLFIFVLSLFTGCQAPGFDPLGMTGPTRVPPPPTGAVGNGYGNDYYSPVPRPAPNAGQGAANWPASNFAPSLNPAAAPSSISPDYRATADTRSATSRSDLQTNDQFDWIDPTNRESMSSRGLVPSNGPTQPLVSTPLRVRGFRNSPDRRELGVPQELADFRNQNLPTGGVRQASAYSNWQSRYDDVRR